MEKKYTYEDLLKVIETLRGENGCSWDREQTHESLIPCMLEESYEVVEAIRNQDHTNLKEELGDVLLQVVLHAQIAKEEEQFAMEEIVDTLTTKLIYRHPHIFGNKEGEGVDARQVQEQWDVLKQKEKNQQTVTQGIEEIAKALPALTRAYKVQKKAAKVGFIWEDYKGVLDKVKEELEEVKEAIEIRGKEGQEEEIGDLLFSIVGLAYFLEINPEFALTKSTEKFINRFRYIENSAFAMKKQLSQMTLEEMDQLWNESKKVESNI